MADIETQVATVKRRIAEAAKARAAAEHQLAVAKDRVEQAVQALRAEFDTDPAGAPALVKKFEADLEAEVKRVEKLLEKAEEQE